MINTNYEVLLDTIRPPDQLMITRRICKYKRVFFLKYDDLIRREKASPAGIGYNAYNKSSVKKQKSYYLLKFCFVLTHLYNNMFLYSGS